MALYQLSYKSFTEIINDILNNVSKRVTIYLSPKIYLQIII